jgi:hypothetical protein
MASENLHAELEKWLQDKGHAPEEIARILAKVRQYETQVQHDSVMDSIGAEHLDFNELIEQAMKS